MVTPVNKKSGQKHAPISSEMKRVWETSPMTRGQFNFVDETPAPPPVEAKKVKPKSTGSRRKTK